MVKNLYEFFDYDFSNIENRLIDLIKRDWILLCIWIGDNECLSSLPTDDPKQKYYAGYYMYMFDHYNKKILQMREEISQEITGEVFVEENSSQVSFVSEAVLKNMICNAYTSQQKSTFNPDIDYMHEDDFFIQWTISEQEPDKMLLLEPTENWKSEVFDEQKWEKVEQYILHWADKYPQYKVAPSYDYVTIVEGFQFLSDKGLHKDAIDSIYEMTPGLFYPSRLLGEEKHLMKYCRKLSEKFGSNYCEALNALYCNNIERFKELFSAETIESVLGYRKI